MRANDRAFTRTELLATLAALFLLGVVALPLLAGSKPRSERMLCLNNLRQIGVAENLWASDHGNLYPCRVPTANGGVQGVLLAGNAWYHFSWISNELSTPKILVCPSDLQKTIAGTWSNDPNGGFLSANFRNNALSYVVGLDAFADGPDHVLSMDRNLNYNGFLSDCSAGPHGVPTIPTPFPPATVGWTDKIHFSSGNVLFTDGRVVEQSSSGFREAIKSGDDNGSVHFLIPE